MESDIMFCDLTVDALSISLKVVTKSELSIS